jgi:hypothetical protein
MDSLAGQAYRFLSAARSSPLCHSERSEESLCGLGAKQSGIPRSPFTENVHGEQERVRNDKRKSLRLYDCAIDVMLTA